MASFIFRGQANAEWGLSSSLERVCKDQGFDLDFLINREQHMLHEFKRRAHLYLRNLPEEENDLEWLALMQHFGAPTRLLDFTSSFYVAAFFAIENSSGDAAVWCFNPEFFQSYHGQYLSGHETIRKIESYFRSLSGEVLSNPTGFSSMAIPVEPYILNERISVQQGLFVLPANITESFEKNLSETLMIDECQFSERLPSDDYHVFDLEEGEVFDYAAIKIVIPQEMHNYILFNLSMMNITAASLFPGLDGYARSLKSFVRDVV
ncbi:MULTISPECIES: FRG domain-containing protein [Chromohalobacter]|nr:MULTISPECIES: FRG domain-containing protein [Chromohalobacter]MCI0508630.1 FRG domain-containing protein [Chromohalobacter sp.]